MRGLRGWLASLLVGASIFACGDVVDDYVRERMSADHLPGVGFAVIDPMGKVDYRCYGVASLETQRPFTPQTIHRIASLSKQMCAYSALSLIRDGKLGLHDSVSNWLPEVPTSWEGMTIWHLLTHTSGIQNPDGWDMSREYSVGEYVALLSEKPLASEPGAEYRYNNHGYSLLGQIVGKSGNGTLPSVVGSYLFEVVGMKSTHYYGESKPPGEYSDAYQWQGDDYIVPVRSRPAVYAGSGGVLSTLEDMVKYELALRSSRLDRGILNSQWTQHNPHLGNYGYGWQVWDGEVRHTGTTYGFTSAYYRDVREGWTVILFRTAESGSQMAMAVEILSRWRGGLLWPRIGTTKLEAR